MISSQSRIVREPVGDDQAGAAAPAQVVVDDRLGLRVEGAGGLVEDQQARIAHQRPGDLQSLALAAGEVPRLLGDGRVVAAPALQQVAVNRRVDPSLDQPLRRDQLVPESQVVADRSLEQADLRIDQRDRVDEDLAGNLGQGLAVVEDLAAPGLVQPGGQPADRGLAAPRARPPAQSAGRAGRRTRTP